MRVMHINPDRHTHIHIKTISTSLIYSLTLIKTSWLLLLPPISLIYFHSFLNYSKRLGYLIVSVMILLNSDQHISAIFVSEMFYSDCQPSPD